MPASKKLRNLFGKKNYACVFVSVALLAACFSAALAADAGTMRIEDFDLAGQANGRKVALVVGNSKYIQNQLTNPVNDARAIADSLKKIGFLVTLKNDLTKEQMTAVFSQFARDLKTGDVVFFYFAGHGLQVGGKNYLLPTDYSSNALESFWEVGKAMDEISSKSDLNIIVLDACRNTSPDLLKLPNAGIGFTEFKTTAGGNFIAFSTSPGDFALDGLTGEKNSPYAAALSSSLLMKPARLEDVFMQTQVEVERATAASPEKAEQEKTAKAARAMLAGSAPVIHKNQVPWTSSSLKKAFYFTADPVAAAPPKKSEFVGSLHHALTVEKLFGGLRRLTFKTPWLNERGSIVEQRPGEAEIFSEPLGAVGLEMAQIAGGRFAMGASAAEINAALQDAKAAAEDGVLTDEAYEVLAAEMPQHSVDVNGFYMSRFEITRAQYAAVMNGLPNIEPGFAGPEMPIVNVTWQEANDFCAKLSKMTGRNYRLPTEAEWEYAARAGTVEPFAFGATLNPQAAVYNSAIPYGKAVRGAQRRAPSKVGEITSPNAFGLQDMSGNVWEWVADYWHADYDGAPANGAAWDEPEIVFDEDENEEVEDHSRVVRGGSWFSPAAGCRSASRFRFFPATRAKNVGFRVVAQ